MCTYYENYCLLAEAIILQAIQDYRTCRSRGEQVSIERFFISGWFGALCDLDGEMILNRIKKDKKI